MKKVFISLIFCIIFMQISVSQTSVTSYDGVSYSVGDTIQIGLPNISADRYEFIYDITPTEYEDIKYYLKAYSEKYQLKYAVIDKVAPKEQNEMFSAFEKSPLLQTHVVNTSDTLFINLDYAIAKKEIVRCLKKQDPNEERLTTHELLAIYYKVYQKEVSDNDLLRYITSKDSELGKECAENAFKFQRVKEEWKADFNKSVANVDFNKVYFIENQVKFGEYDFDKLGYGVYYDTDKYEKENNTISFDSFYSPQYYPYSFLIKNIQSKNIFGINPEIAEKFELTQKGVDYYNHLYSNKFARIYLKFSKEPVVYPKSDKGIALRSYYGDNLLNVEIQKVDIYDHDSYLYNYIGTIE